VPAAAEFVDCFLPRVDAGFAARNVASLLRVAGDRADDLLFVWPQAQRFGEWRVDSCCS